MIDINNITVRIGSKVLLEQASAHISDGWKVGLVGHNGCGKSTLFRVFQGELETELGDVSFPAGSRVVTVAQELSDIDVPILDFVLAQDKERTELLKKLETAPEEEYGEIHEQLRVIGAAAAEGRAAAILNGLGFSNDDLHRQIKEFSGGWRMRLALAAALFRPSDILLLDEPTNHLDLEASIWLESHLRRYTGTLLLISHDRFILNDLCNHIIHFENKKLNTYSGNYDTFQKTRTLQREVQAKQIAKQEVQRKHLQSFVDRFRYKASKAKQAQSRLKMLEKIEALPPLASEYAGSFDFPEPQELASPLVVLDGVSAGYGDMVVLKNLSLRIVENDRIALLGANGNGKSTFAKLVSGRLTPMGGTVIRTRKLEVGYFAQHQSEELPLEMTACGYMATLMPDIPETKVRAHLARFGLTQEKSATVISKLSGGEKARLLFAVMSRNAPSLLILDEPTNHLDIEGRDALVEALNAYRGAVILITHDLHLTELIADDLWLVKNHTVKPYVGDLEDYKKSLIEEKIIASPKKEAVKKEDKRKGGNYFEIKQLNSDIKRLEKLLDKLADEKSAMEQKFAEPLSTDELIALQKDFDFLQKRIEETEAEWLDLSEKLEEAR
uniref:Glycosyl transferase family 1 n=1 Tax=uncultured Alphaproteobacteria bacterium TaxID=91750 RepID=A0A6G8F253_9PROT|nr:glycosyl transferase family 1 [uncultured Alphaproteobacteria bacterium]